MKFPFFKQLDSQDCAVFCLKMVSYYYGKKIGTIDARRLCRQDKVGVTMLSLSKAAEAIGFETMGVRISRNKFLTSIDFPAIAQVNKKHFVVIWGIQKETVIVGDPAAGTLFYNLNDFFKLWLIHPISEPTAYGFILLLAPSEQFTTESLNESKKYTTRSILKFLKPHKILILQLFLSLSIGSLISLLLPYLAQSIVDIGITSHDSKFISYVLIGQLSLSLGLCISRYISSWLVLHLSSRVSISMVSFFLEKLMRMHISFFDSKKIGDILLRISDFGRIEVFLTSSLVSILIAALSIAVYGSILFKYGVLLFLVFTVGSVIYLGWIYALKKYRRKLDYQRFQHVSEDQSLAVHYIRGMKEIKLFNCEKNRLKKWQDIQLKLYKIKMSALILSQIQETGAILIDQSKNLIITFICSYWVMHESFTMGMMIAVTYIIGQLNSPVYQLSSFIQSLQEAQISLERINEVNVGSDEILENEGKISEFSLDAPIAFNSVSFSYPNGRNRRILHGLTFKILPKSVTAIVGESGSGKSTLLKLLMGFYLPTDGNISIGHLDLNSINIRSWRKKCSSVLQEGYLFTESIFCNIAIGEDKIDKERVIQAAQHSKIHDFIMSLPMQYETIIGEDGLTLSAGQKQRICIARAIYKDTPLLLLDEATNSLDTCNENDILESLKSFYKDKTVVIVAHRLSTILNADQILVMKEGQIVESGIHSDLIKRGGYYSRLIANQTK